MKKHYLRSVVAAGVGSLLFISFSASVFAGNKDRIGQAGGNQLLINPWSQSTGWGGANSAACVGLESGHLNISGLSFVKKSEILFSRTSWLKGSDININAFGFAQRVGESAVIGGAVMSMNFGDIEITTVDLPEGGIGTFSPQFINLGLSYAREFSNSIFGGITLRTVSESIADATARGVAFDAGIRYVTGERDHVKFGIALRNVGPKMDFAGDGFATKVTLNDEEFTLEQRTEPYELPSLLNIGAAYDIYIHASTDSASKEIKSNHRVTLAGNFTSNSFGKDVIRFGAEYAFKSMLMLRLGYMYEEGTFKNEERTTVFTGPTAGFGLAIPMGKNGASLGLNYSYRATNPFQGTHSIGARINI